MVGDKKIPYREQATKDPYYTKFTAMVFNERKKMQRCASMDCRRLQSYVY